MKIRDNHNYFIFMKNDTLGADYIISVYPNHDWNVMEKFREYLTFRRKFNWKSIHEEL